MAKVISISFRKEKEPLVDQLEKIAEMEHMSVSEILVSMIEDYVKAHSSGNPNIPLGAGS